MTAWAADYHQARDEGGLFQITLIPICRGVGGRVEHSAGCSSRLQRTQTCGLPRTPRSPGTALERAPREHIHSASPASSRRQAPHRYRNDPGSLRVDARAGWSVRSPAWLAEERRFHDRVADRYEPWRSRLAARARELTPESAETPTWTAGGARWLWRRPSGAQHYQLVRRAESSDKVVLDVDALSGTGFVASETARSTRRATSSRTPSTASATRFTNYACGTSRAARSDCSRTASTTDWPGRSTATVCSPWSTTRPTARSRSMFTSRTGRRSVGPVRRGRSAFPCWLEGER